jgi:hypothetical protein
LLSTKNQSLSSEAFQARSHKFQNFPQKLEEFDESKGVEFHQGKNREPCHTKKFVIWNSILVVETRSNTADSKQILEEALLWGAGRFGLNYKPGMIKRFAYVSGLTFHSDVSSFNTNPAVNATRCGDQRYIRDLARAYRVRTDGS